jgi:hypothetical protein
MAINLEVLENRALRRIFGPLPPKKEVAGG